MLEGSFRKRGNALEDEFFHRVDVELIRRWKVRHEEEVADEALQQAIGITDQHVLKELRQAEITPGTLVALSLFPAIYVAWADGHVELAERRAILRAADDLGIAEDSPSHALLECWLKRKPRQELVTTWKDFIHAIQPTLSETAFNELKQASIQRAEEIARAAGGFLGIGAVSTEEKSALTELREVFDHALSTSKPTD